MNSPRDTNEKPLSLKEFHNKVEKRYKLAEKPNLKEKDIFIIKKNKNRKN